MAYYLAPSLAALRAEANARYPDRDKTSDGWIGDTSHAARRSDHNPDWSAGGIVRAYDLDEDLDGDGLDHGAELSFLAEYLRLSRDPRIKYVIYEGRMFASYDSPNGRAWKWRTYDGVNAHRKHLHVSVLATHVGENDTRPWFPTATEAPPIPPTPPEDDMPYTPEQLIQYARSGVARELADPESDGRQALEQIVAAQVDKAIDGDVKRLAAFLTTGRETALFDPARKGNEWMAEAPTLATLASLSDRLDALEARLGGTGT